MTWNESAAASRFELLTRDLSVSIPVLIIVADFILLLFLLNMQDDIETRDPGQYNVY